MSIIHLLPLIYAGGPTIIVRDILIELKKNNPNFKIELWVLSKIENSRFSNNKKSLEFEKKILKELKIEGVYVCFSERKSSKDIYNYWLFLLKNLKRLNPDIVHFHSETGTLISLPILLFHNSKIFQTIHSEKILNQKLQKNIIQKFIQGYIAVTDETKVNLIKIGINEKKITVIKNGINLTKYENDRVIKKNVEKFIAIGRLTEAKNYKMLIKSYMTFINYLKERGEAKLPILNIIGDGEEREELENYIMSKKAYDNIFLLGIKNNIDEYLKESDVFLMSSIWEGLPIVLIEAAASAIPIIATDVGGNHYVLEGNAGKLVKTNDHTAFSEAIIDLYDNYDLRIRISEKLITNANSFKIKNVVEELQKIYEECININLFLDNLEKINLKDKL